jgi:WXXGXW repeat (2 copies)
MFTLFKNTVCVAICGLTLFILPDLAAAQLAPVSPSLTIVGVQPPPPISEIKPRHTGGQIWIPGYWNWNGRTFIWQAGHFDHERRGQVYVPAAWESVGQGWALIPGHWVNAQ